MLLNLNFGNVFKQVAGNEHILFIGLTPISRLYNGLHDYLSQCQTIWGDLELPKMKHQAENATL